MIATISEMQLFANMSTLTHEERAVLQSIHSAAEAAVKRYLKYDPEQDVRIEYYPRHYSAGGPGMYAGGHWDVNPARTKAIFVSNRTLTKTLQLEHIPVRAVTEVNVDYNANHAQADDAFGTDTALTAGSDYWIEFDQPDVCESGCLVSSSGWTLEPGCIKITYRAGYSADEFNSHTLESSVAADGTITTKGVDAGSIKRAVILTALKAIQTWQAFRKDARGQFVPGGLKSERLQDYSYTTAGSVAASTAGLLTELPAEAMDALEDFRHWGQLRL